MADVDPIAWAREVHAAATPGPYRVAHHDVWEVEAPPQVLVADCGSVGRAEADARAMATAVNMLPPLLAVLEAARADDRCVDHAAPLDWCTACSREAQARAALSAAVDTALAVLRAERERAG